MISSIHFAKRRLCSPTNLQNKLRKTETWNIYIKTCALLSIFKAFSNTQCKCKNRTSTIYLSLFSSISICNHNHCNSSKEKCNIQVFHDITKAAARLCVLVCNPFARSAGIFWPLPPASCSASLCVLRPAAPASASYLQPVPHASSLCLMPPTSGWTSWARYFFTRTRSNQSNQLKSAWTTPPHIANSALQLRGLL